MLKYYTIIGIHAMCMDLEQILFFKNTP